MRGAGVEVAFWGEYDGVARALVSAADVRVVRDAGDASAVVVDSYSVGGDELAALAERVAVAHFSDEGVEPLAAGVRAVLNYHPDPARVAFPFHVKENATRALAGPLFAPVDPVLVAARRERGFERALVTLGASGAAGDLGARAAEELETLGLEVEALGPGAGGDATPAGLAEAIERTDIAVSGAGVTAYELACAGVPSLIARIADNQAAVANGFEANRIALTIDATTPTAPVALRAAVGKLADQRTRTELTTNATRQIDGYGAFRARDALLAAFDDRTAPPTLRYRPATQADSQFILDTRNDPDTRANSRTTDEIDPDTHAAWLTGVLSDPDRTLLVADDDDGPAATIRFDREGDEAEIGIAVAPARRGAGLGARAIRQTSELMLAAHPSLTRVTAQVNAANRRSLTAFERAGFAPVERGTWTRLALDRAGLLASAPTWT
jgi:spore coat polysaccharide biosynthesis predicted glycosyltransferase SpsG/GNAT superfamily N-acetyltransferase